MTDYILDLKSLNKSSIHLTGGKASNLGEISELDGIRVPLGFCIKTNAYAAFIDNILLFRALLNELSNLKIHETQKVKETSAHIRNSIEQADIPFEIEQQIVDAITKFGENKSYAVRSSSTAEDSYDASFAGQHDSFLNINGKKEILDHVKKCWVSLFTDSAIIYRIQNGIDHHTSSMAVIVQEMVQASASGVLFTADPVSGNRKLASVNAVYGLGESFVSGLVNADHYKILEAKITDKNIILDRAVLSDDLILQLAAIGRKIEKHYGCPQDIEWCVAQNTFYILQSRPVTTLFPIPKSSEQGKHIFLSVGHQQMMTDAMKPLGICIHQLVAMRPMFTAGGRLFVDITNNLSTPDGRQMMLNAMAQHDPLIHNALFTLLKREFPTEIFPEQDKIKSTETIYPGVSPDTPPPNRAIVQELILKMTKSIEDLKSNIQLKSGVELFDFILSDMQVLKQMLFDTESKNAIKAGMDAAFWLNTKMNEWLGEKNAADILSQSVPFNITSEMGLELLNLADEIRPFPDVIHYLKSINKKDFLNNLDDLQGGKETSEAIIKYLNKYGMRCSGEIDITRERWSENPASLIHIILNNIKSFDAGEAKRRFDHGKEMAFQKEKQLLERLTSQPEGEEKVIETKNKIEQLRNFIGYREYPKYGIVNRYYLYKQALMKEGENLLKLNLMENKEDIFFLTFEELREAVQNQNIDKQIIDRRKKEHKYFERLVTPRIINSDGEIFYGSYRKEKTSDNVLPGLAVSAGVFEGRARVILKMENADLKEGDILVTTFTDPSWTPLFVLIKGLVTEVGGLMTHGAVIAREYGLPAVVGVENATRLIKDGDRIRVNGMDGFVEIL